MPTRPPHPCNHPGCPVLTHAARCLAHAAEHQRTYDASRGPARQWYASSRWRRFRAAVLADSPACVGCGAAATEVDHVRPRSTWPELAYERENVQTMCKGCHSRKTRREP